MNYKQTAINILKHAVVWVIFIAYELSIVYILGSATQNWWVYVLYYILNICLFYANASLFEWLFNTRFNRFVGIVLLIIGELCVYLFLQYWLNKFLIFIHLHPQTNILQLKGLLLQCYRAIYFIGFSIAYWFARSIIKQRKIILELENAKLRQEAQSTELEKNLVQAKNAYLQSQLNPHLLFNTLNFIYNSVRKHSNQGAQAILLLSDMMRYSLSDIGADGKVFLEKEIDHINNMVRLNQLRFNETLNVQFTQSGVSGNERIIPLLLISFVENAFKHGDLTDSKQPLNISVACANNVFEMSCINKRKKPVANAGWGIGIENAKKRLENYYQNRYKLNIVEQEKLFNVSLLIEL